MSFHNLKLFYRNLGDTKWRFTDYTVCIIVLPGHHNEILEDFDKLDI